MHNTEIDLSGDQFVSYMFTENGSLSNLTPLQKRKQYVYNCNVFGKNLNLDEFTNKIFLQWKLENCSTLYLFFTYLSSEINK